MADNDRSPDFPIELPNYEFKKLLDRGGMGAVYLAEQQSPRREVAIKIIAPDDLPKASPEILRTVLEMLQHEGDVAARFNHENLITVHECGVVDGHYFLAMEYLPGGSLRERIGSGLAPDDAAFIVREIAQGLAEMHADGVLHRDIKPENILFRKNGKPVLMDYGVAKDAETVSRLTRLGLSTGTPEYMSPEQVDERPVDARSDLYALGILFHELLTGEVPYTGKTALAVAYAHVNHPVPRLPKRLESYQPIIDRLLAKDPAQRFQSADELIAALGGEAPAGSPTRVTPLGSARPRTTMLGELKRRKVLHTAGLYGVSAFGISEILTFVFENFGMPLWANRLVAALFVAGFPIAMFLSWAFDIEPGGRLRKTRFQGRSPAPVIAAAMVLLVAATGGLFYLIFPRDAVPVPSRLQADAERAESPRARPSEASVAVLAFKDLSPSGDKEWFSDGLSEEIINSLARLPELSVAARTSSFYFKNQNATLDEIGRVLKVAHVVEGSIRQAADQLRITAQLIRADSGFPIWSKTYDVSMADVFAVQQDVAESIAGALNVVLDDDKRQAMTTFGTRDVEAYQDYLKGLQLYHGVHNSSVVSQSFETGHLWQANDWFDKAIAADPSFAAPHFLRADAFTHFLAGEDFVGAPSGMTASKALSAARDTYKRAADLARDPASQLLFDIHLAFYADDWATVSRLLDEVEFNEASFQSLTTLDDLIEIQIAFGRAEDALRIADAIIERDPLDLNMRIQAIKAIWAAHGPEAGLRRIHTERAATGNPDLFLIRELLMLLELGQIDRAVSVVSKFDENEEFYGFFRAMVLALAGRRAEAEQIVNDMIERGSHVPMRVHALMSLGRFEEARASAMARDAAPGGPMVLARVSALAAGGKLLFLPSWTPNLTASMARAGVQAEVIEFPGIPRPDEGEQGAANRHQPRPGAHEQLVLGRQALARRSAESLYAAVRHLEAAMEIDPDYAQPYAELALAYFLLPFYDQQRSREEDHRQGRAMIDKALELDPLAGEAYAIRTRFEDDPAVRQQDFLKAIELSPGYATAHYYYGLFLVEELGRTDEGVQELLRAAELEPTATHFQRVAAEALFRAGRHEEAITLARRNFDRNPDDPRSIGLVGGFLRRLGRLGEAQLWYAEERRRAPDLEGAWAEEVMGLLDLGDLQAAEAVIEAFIELHPESREIPGLTGAVHYYRGEIDQAIPEAVSYLMNHRLAPARIALADIYCGRGQFDRALDLLANERSDLFESEPEPTVRDADAALTLAMVFHGLEDTDRRNALIGALERLPEYPGSVYGASWAVYIQAMRGNREGAIAALGDAIDARWRHLWWFMPQSWLLRSEGLLDDPEFAAELDKLMADIDRQRERYYARRGEPLL